MEKISFYVLVFFVDLERSLSLAGREALQGSTYLEAHWFWAGGVDL